LTISSAGIVGTWEKLKMGMKCKAFWVIGAIIGLASPAASQNGPLKLKLAPFHVIATSGAPIGEVRTAQPGIELLQADLGFKRAAQLHGAQSITLLGLTFDIAEADVLRAATPERENSRLGPMASLYCSGTLELSKKLRGSSGERGARFSRKVGLCLVDADADGRFDHGFIDGANWAEDQQPITISPLSYSVRELAPIPGARLRITYEKGAALQGPILSMESNLVNGQFAYAEARIGPDPARAPRLWGETGIKGTYPRTFTYGDAQVTILGLNSETRTLTYRIEHGFETQPAIVKIGYYGMYGSTEYTFK